MSNPPSLVNDWLSIKAVDTAFIKKVADFEAAVKDKLAVDRRIVELGESMIVDVDKNELHELVLPMDKRSNFRDSLENIMIAQKANMASLKIAINKNNIGEAEVLATEDDVKN